MRNFALLSLVIFSVSPMAHASPPGPGDRAADFVDTLNYSRLTDMDRAGLGSAELPSDPWSGSAWPLYRGGIAWRYADTLFPDSMDWNAANDYLLGNLGMGPVATLSPAEKYDLLVGDPNFTLTRANLSAGQYFERRDGSVPATLDLSHGWAPASIMTPLPLHGLVLTAPDGVFRIPFSVSDIEALATLLWANGEYPFRRTDGGPEGENPATWHLAIVNQIGVTGRSLIASGASGTPGGNYPVVGYRCFYFNPETLQPAGTLAEATVSRMQFPHDRFLPRRAPTAATFAGVAMDVTMVASSWPGEASDAPRLTATYVYDLELDASGRIVGGEWYRDAHPASLWMPDRDARAESIGDEGLSANSGAGWDGRAPVPRPWQPAAARASASAQPLARLVGALLRLSAY